MRMPLLLLAAGLGAVPAFAQAVPPDSLRLGRPTPPAPATRRDPAAEARARAESRSDAERWRAEAARRERQPVRRPFPEAVPPGP
jgi:hypothetical protein